MSQKSLRDLYDTRHSSFYMHKNISIYILVPSLFETVKELALCLFFNLPIKGGSILPFLANRLLNLSAIVVFNPSLLIATAVLSCEIWLVFYK